MQQVQVITIEFHPPPISYTKASGNMIFTARIFSLGLALLSVGSSVVTALPSPILANLERRDNTDFEGVLNNLKTTTDSVLPQLCLFSPSNFSIFAN
jgi:hypothetical protein